MRHAPPTTRNVGLDILRCCAILPVVVYHMPLPFAPLEQWGFLGVEAFFALSGFLIAQMIAERFDGVRTADALATFLVNRWMRTLPLYFLALAAHVWITRNYAGLARPGMPVVGDFAHLPELWPFLTLTQNFWHAGTPGGDWFGVSWTLALEEWFYLIVPAWLFVGARLGWRFETLIVRIAAAVIVASVAARLARHYYLSAPGSEGHNFEDLFRRPVLFRMDALCYGALAYVAMTRFAVAAARYRAHCAVVCVALLWLVLDQHPLPGQTGLFQHVFYWMFAPLAVCFALPMFALASIQSASLARVAAFMSTRTYALYLVHMLVALLFVAFVTEITPLTAPALLVADLVVADLIYRLVERPILRLRPMSVVGCLERLKRPRRFLTPA